MSVHGFTDRSGKGTHAITFTICHSARCSSVRLLIRLRASFKTWRLRESTTAIHLTSELTIRCGGCQCCRSTTSRQALITRGNTTATITEQQTTAAASAWAARASAQCTRSRFIWVIRTVDRRTTSSGSTSNTQTACDAIANSRGRTNTPTTTHQAVRSSATYACSNTRKSWHHLSASRRREHVRVQELVHNLRHGLVQTLDESTTETHHLRSQDQQHNS